MKTKSEISINIEIYERKNDGTRVITFIHIRVFVWQNTREIRFKTY